MQSYRYSEKMNSGFAPRRRGVPNPGIGNLAGNPFAFATVSIAFLGWLCSLVSSVFCQIRSPTTGNDQFGKFIWWVVVYELLCILFVSWAIIQDVKDKFAPAIIGYLAVLAGFLTLSVNTLVFSSAPERVANAVGFIVLSIVTFLWIFYFGQNGSSHEYPLPKDARYSTRQPSRPMSHFDRPRTTASGQHTQNLYTSAQLNNGGFETSSPVSGYPGGPVGGQERNISQTRFQGPSHPHTPTTAKANNQIMDAPVDVEGPTEYPYSAKAIYSYEANPDDANEISFVKHEILEVSDVSGRWWQARKENGEKGIAPSNYLILL